MTEGVRKTGLRVVVDSATSQVRVETFPVHADDWPEGWSETEIGAPMKAPTLPDPSPGARREILREEEAVRRELAQYRRKRVILRLSLELAPLADSFCRRVNDSERGEGPGLGYDEVGRLLRAYLQADLSEEQVCEAVNARLQETEPCPKCEEFIRRLSKLQEDPKHEDAGVRPLRHVVWELRPLPRASKKGKKGWPRFELDKDGGATDAWRDFAELLGHGVTLRRLKCCAYEPCKRLFFDRTPRGDQTGCTRKHAGAVASRTYRRKRQKAGHPS